MTTELDNDTLEWAAQWIEDSLKGETNERTVQFGNNMAMTLRAAKSDTRVSAASTAPVVDELKLNNDEIGALINYNLRKLGEAPCKESARVFRTRVERLRAIYEN